MAKGTLYIQPRPVGAEVIGMKPGDESNPDVKAQLYEAWLKHGILLFTNVDTIERHLALSRCFGELEQHPLPEIRSEEHPLLIQLGGKKGGPAYVYDETELVANRLPWHRDTAYTPDVCKGAMLRMLEIPSSGGETLFADTALAYNDLPNDMKERLRGLEYKGTLRITPMDQTRPGALWRTVRPATKEEDPEERGIKVTDQAARYPSVVHPVVLEHPESGMKCIFLSPTYVDYFLGMGQEESDELLQYLVAHMLQPRYVYKHTWSVNEAILWDNRRFMHAGMGTGIGERRRGLRTTLAQPTRVGRYFDETAQRDQLPILAD